MSPKTRGFRDVAYEMLKELGQPVRLEELAKTALDRGMVSSNAQDPVASLVGTLRNDALRTSNPCGFKILDGGYVALAEWGESVAATAPVRHRRRRQSASPQPQAVTPAGVTLEKLERIRQAIPAQEFEEDWGELYQRLKAEERARQITPVTDRQLAERARAVVDRLHAFLQGSSQDAPKSDVICDWIFICYTLELHREGAALWHFVNKDEVDAAKYERTAKYSAACRTRVG